MGCDGTEHSRRTPGPSPSRWCLARSMGLLRVWEYPLLYQILDSFAYAFYDIFKGIVMRGPPGDSLAIGRENLEFGEGRSLPVGGTQDDGQDTRLVGIMPGNRLHHLDTVTEIGGYEVCADQQQNDLIRVEVLHDLGLPVGSRTDIPIIPGGDDVLSSQVAQVRFQFLVECSIAMSIGDEDGKRHVNLLWWCSMLLGALYPETQQLSLRV